MAQLRDEPTAEERVRLVDAALHLVDIAGPGLYEGLNAGANLYAEQALALLTVRERQFVEDYMNRRLPPSGKCLRELVDDLCFGGDA